MMNFDSSCIARPSDVSFGTMGGAFPTANRSAAARQAFQARQSFGRFAPDGFHPGLPGQGVNPGRLPWGDPLPQAIPFRRAPAPTPFMPYDPWGRQMSKLALPLKLAARASEILFWGTVAYQVYESLKPNDYARIYANGACGAFYLHHRCTPPPRIGAVDTIFNSGFQGGCLENQVAIGPNACVQPFGSDAYHYINQQWIDVGPVTRYDYKVLWGLHNQTDTSYVFPPRTKVQYIPGSLSEVPRPFVPNGYFPALDARPDTGTGPSPFRPAPQYRDAPYRPSLPLGSQTYTGAYSADVPRVVIHPEVTVTIEILPPGTRGVPVPKPNVAVDTTTNPANPPGGVPTPGSAAPRDKKYRADSDKTGHALFRIGQRLISRGPAVYSEVNDLVESIWKGLPKKYQRMHKRTIAGKYEAVFEHWDKIEWNRALHEVLVNELQDRLIGAGFGLAKKGAGFAGGHSVETGVQNFLRQQNSAPIWNQISTLQ